jgi:KDO2-lipid IV(A) lauroyltransferase
VGDIAYFIDRRHRNIAFHNLRMAFSETKSDAEIRRITREVFRNFSRTAVEFLQIPSLTLEKAASYITPENRERLDDCLKRAKGVVLIASHFGNWELMAAAGALAGYTISVVSKPMKNLFWYEITNDIRRTSGLKLIPRDGSALTIMKSLKRNEIIGILADQNTRKLNVFVDFFGIKAATTPAPAFLALRAGAALVPIFMIRDGSSDHRLIIEKPLEVKPTGDIRADAEALTQQYNNVLERYVREYPGQWLWLHRRWRTRPPGEARLY